MSDFIEEDTDHVGDTEIVSGAPAKGKSALLEAFGAELKRTLQQQRGVIEFARVALPGLVDVCAAKTGQSYKVRALLYSAWNGQATSLLELVSLDWAIKRDVLTVLLAFGCEPGGGTPAFFYDAISDAFKAAGLFEWFCEAHKEVPET